jgi:hypothetical protein
MGTLAYRGLGRIVDIEVRTPRSWLIRLLAPVQQMLCGLSRNGHEMILKTDGRRLYLLCRHCFHETEGWTLDPSLPDPPSQRQRT